MLFVVADGLSGQDADPTGLFFDALPFAGSVFDNGGNAADSSDLSVIVGTVGRIDLYAAVPYRLLEFSRVDEAFEAAYRMRLRIEGESGIVFDSTITRIVATPHFGRTDGSEPAADFYQYRIPVSSGSYRATIDLLDETSRLQTEDRRDVGVLDFSRYSFSMSGLLLLSQVRSEGEGMHSVVPMLTDDIATLGTPYFLLFETYNRREIDEISIDALYRDAADSIVWQETFRRTVGAGRDQGWIRLPSDGLRRGTYRVELVARSIDARRDTLALAERSVRVTGRVDGMPIDAAALEARIKQLRYAATQTEYDLIDAARTFADRRERYAAFWLTKDPTPRTPENEAMTEYFARVTEANKRFRSYAEGWLTDMGRIYIVFGKPDRIDRDPFASEGRPEETWEYFRYGRSVRFVDQTGFGDFRLAMPVPFSEKFRYR